MIPRRARAPVRGGLLALACLALEGLSLDAQEPVRFGVRWGVTKSSFELTDVNGNAPPGDNERFDSRLTMHAGISLRIPLGGRWALQPEILVARKGADWDWIVKRGQRSVDTLRREMEIEYVEVPLLLAFRAIETSAVDLEVVFGGAFAFPTKCVVIQQGGLEGGDCAGSYGLGSGASEGDFSLFAGTSLFFAVGAARMGLEGRYAHGLGQLGHVEFQATEGMRVGDVRNRAIFLSLAVEVPVPWPRSAGG